MTQPDLFDGNDKPARQPQRPDLPLLLAASTDHIVGAAMPTPAPAAPSVAVPRIAGKTVPQMARMIARSVEHLTDINDHGGARMKIAEAYQLADAIDQLRLVSGEHARLGHMTSDLIARREEITLAMFRAINLADQTGEATAILDRCL